MKDPKHLSNVRRGHQVNDLKRHIAWIEIIEPMMKLNLDIAHRAVFDQRIKEFAAKERIAYYLGVRKFSDMLEGIERARIQGQKMVDKEGTHED